MNPFVICLTKLNSKVAMLPLEAFLLILLSSGCDFKSKTLLSWHYCSLAKGNSYGSSGAMQNVTVPINAGSYLIFQPALWHPSSPGALSIQGPCTPKWSSVSWSSVPQDPPTGWPRSQSHTTQWPQKIWPGWTGPKNKEARRIASATSFLGCVLLTLCREPINPTKETERNVPVEESKGAWHV